MLQMESYIYYTTDHKYCDLNVHHTSQLIEAFPKLPTHFLLGSPVYLSEWKLNQRTLSNNGRPLQPEFPVPGNSCLSEETKANNASSATRIFHLRYIWKRKEKKCKKKSEWALVKALFSCSPLCTVPAGHLGCRWCMFCDMIYVSRTQVI